MKRHILSGSMHAGNSYLFRQESVNSRMFTHIQLNNECHESKYVGDGIFTDGNEEEIIRYPLNFECENINKPRHTLNILHSNGNIYREYCYYYHKDINKVFDEYVPDDEVFAIY